MVILLEVCRGELEIDVVWKHEQAQLFSFCQTCTRVTESGTYGN